MRHADRFTLLTAVLAMMFAVPDLLCAQTVTSDSTRLGPDSASATAVEPPASLPANGAPLIGLRAGVHSPEMRGSTTPTVVAASHANLGPSRAMMVVGLAGLIVGAIIGGTPGTIIMVGGALVGLKGLYDYMQ